MTTTIMQQVFSQEWQLVPAAAVAAGLGPAILIVDSDAAGLADEDFGLLSLTGPDDVTSAGAALTAAQGSIVNAMFGQLTSPSVVVVLSYDSGAGVPETPADALDRYVASGLSYGGVLCTELLTDGVLAAIQAWIAASSSRRLRFIFFAQSADSGLVTATAPAGLATLKDSAGPVTPVSAHDATAVEDAPHAAALAARFAAFDLPVRQTDPAIVQPGPMAMRLQLASVAVPGFTAAEYAFALGNGCNTAMGLDAGSLRSTILSGGSVSAYNGQSVTAWTSIMGLAQAIYVGVRNDLQRRAILGSMLPATVEGAGILRAIISEACDLYFEAGWLVAGISGSAPNEIVLPKGYRVQVAIVGAELRASVTARVGQEVQTISVNGRGEVA